MRTNAIARTDGVEDYVRRAWSTIDGTHLSGLGCRTARISDKSPYIYLYQRGRGHSCTGQFYLVALFTKRALLLSLKCDNIWERKCQEEKWLPRLSSMLGSNHARGKINASITICPTRFSHFFPPVVLPLCLYKMLLPLIYSSICLDFQREYL